MSTRYYPLYQKGNPQLRIFLPNFWMKLVKSEEPLPPNVVLFQTSIAMTKYDVKNYLEKIYKVPVVDVKTTIKMGSFYKNLKTENIMKNDDYKEALVYLPEDYTFEFPEIKEEKSSKEFKMYEKVREEYRQSQLKTSPKPFSPNWFMN